MAEDIRKQVLEQMRVIKRRLDPDVVDRVRLAKEGKVPYDRENARAAVDHFLQSLDDGGRFRRKLAERLKKTDH